MQQFPKTARLVALIMLVVPVAVGQGRKGHGAPRPVTIPVTIKVHKPEVEIRVVDFMLREDGDLQSLLSTRRPADNPVTLAVLTQDDLTSSIGNETKGVANFIRQLPSGSRVMGEYYRPFHAEPIGSCRTNLPTTFVSLPIEDVKSSCVKTASVTGLSAGRRIDSRL